MQASSLNTQGTRFIISGAISAVVDFGLTTLFQFAFGWDPGQAKTIGFIFGTATAYMINRRWTFQAEPSWRRLFAVCVLYAVTYLINRSLYKYGFFLLENWGWAKGMASISAFVVAQGTATVVNFVIQRAWIFKVR